MANGTADEKLARADRIKEQSLKAQKRAEQHQKATANAIASIRERGPIQPGQTPYRAEMESEISEVKVPGGTARLPIPRAGRLAIGFGLGVLFVCIGVAIVLKAW